MVPKSTQQLRIMVVQSKLTVILLGTRDMGLSVDSALLDVPKVLYTPSCKNCSEGKNDQRIQALEGVRGMFRQPKNH